MKNLQLIARHLPEIVVRALPWFAIALIGAGAWCIYRPAAPIAIGLLILLDLNKDSGK